ncbi:MAG TPA: tyrosine-type recombinase/integrase [Streptosporangiaceae bacterium]
MSAPGQGAGADEMPGPHPGLLAALMAAIRPEFRAEVLAFAPGDPVFGGPACRVAGCGRTARSFGMCLGHWERWADAGRPDLELFAASPARAWKGHALLAGCAVAGCGFGAARRGLSLCSRHVSAWHRAGRPSPGQWAAALAPVAMPAGQATCQIGSCQLWAHRGSVLCHVHDRRWKDRGRPDLAVFIAWQEGEPAGERERADLTPLPRQLRLELQYAVQRRRDEKMARITAAEIRQAVRLLVRGGFGSVLDRGELEWRDSYPPGNRGARFLVYAHRKVTALAEGEGWDNEYPRGIWRLRRLGIQSPAATLRFDGISQPWLRELAKRWTRWRLSAGMEAGGTCYRGVQAITRFSVFLRAAGITEPGQADRQVLERYLADLASAMTGRSGRSHRGHIGQIGTFLRDIRHHQWDPPLPPTAMIFPEDYPREGLRLPRALAEQVMAQVEDPANLARWKNPAHQLITMILIRCGLRISDATGLPYGCVVRDGDGAPYLRYWNRKMKREALVPIDDELEQLIAAQQHRAREGRPEPPPVLFPRVTSNIGGNRPVPAGTYRWALDRWLQDCDIRDEHGQPVHLTPHQWRHTLGTRLINRDVPQHVVQKILDHDSPAMTAHYARLSDKTVRKHWDKARKVGATGQPVQISPDGPLGDAAWAKQQLSRATQALPNGYCQLPMVKTCPHANSCLTCPMFVTTAEFLPQHHAQRQATLQLITAAEVAGHARVAEMNKQVAANLEQIITALEADGDEQEAAADAS